MKTILKTVPDDKAPKELKGFAIAAFTLNIISLFVFWWLSIAAIAAGGRALLLSFHNGTKNMKDLWVYRLLAGAGLVIGVGIVAYSFKG